MTKTGKPTGEGVAPIGVALIDLEPKEMKVLTEDLSKNEAFVILKGSPVVLVKRIIEF